MLSVKGGVLGDGIHHEEWSNDPVDEDAKADLFPHLPVGKELVERFISHFAEDGIHHDE
jgi:hypothetical protein